MQCASSTATMHTLRCKAGSASNRLHSGDATVSGDIKTKILLNNYFNLYEIRQTNQMWTFQPLRRPCVLNNMHEQQALQEIQAEAP